MGPPALYKFLRQKTWPHEEVAGRFEELAVEMGYVVKEMRDDTPQRFTGIGVFLSTNVTKSSM